MQEKYPDNYFEHFMEMYNSNLTEKGLKDHLKLAKSIDGRDYVEGLKNERLLMKSDNDS